MKIGILCIPLLLLAGCSASSVRSFYANNPRRTRALQLRDIKSGEFLKKAKEHERKAAAILEKAKGQSPYQKGLAYEHAAGKYILAHY